MGTVSAARFAKRLLIVDDHPIVREGIGLLLAQQPDVRVCGTAVDVASARQAVRDLAPDIALVDLSLGRDSGIDVIRLLAVDAPGLPILALSMHDEQLYAKRVLQAGGRGYIMKHEATELLLQAIRTVLAGDIYVSARMNACLLRSIGNVPEKKGSGSGPLSELSNRELEVYRLIGQGLATKEIASRLFVSSKTVEAHRARIKTKLGIDSSSALVAHAAEWLFRGGPTPPRPVRPVDDTRGEPS